MTDCRPPRIKKGMKKASVLEYNTKPMESSSTGGMQSVSSKVSSVTRFLKLEKPGASMCIGVEIRRDKIQAVTIISEVLRIFLSAIIFAYLEMKFSTLTFRYIAR